MLKKLLGVVVAGFGVFYLLTQPTDAAAAIHNAAGGILKAFDSVTVFVQELAS